MVPNVPKVSGCPVIEKSQPSGFSAVVFVLIAIGAVCQPALALGFCSEPSVPSSYLKPDKPREPQAPFCVNKITRTHTCSDWQIDSYNRDLSDYSQKIRRYQSDVETYIRKLKTYLEEAEQYAVCEVKSLDAD
jgi:hypothetical protein